MDSVVLETESVLFTSRCVTCRFAVLKPMVFKLAGEGDTAVDSQLGPGLLKQRPLGWGGNAFFNKLPREF